MKDHKRIHRKGVNWPADPVKVDKGIPLPPRRNANRVYPWNELEVGDSFLFGTTTTLATARSRAHEYSRMSEHRFNEHREFFVAET